MKISRQFFLLALTLLGPGLADSLAVSAATLNGWQNITSITNKSE